MNNIFVGNLSFVAKKEDVRKLFETFGVVVGVAIVEKKKGKSRGFAFVDMPNEEERTKAMTALTGKEFMGRELSVVVAIPKVKSAFKTKKFKNSVPSREHKDDRAERTPYRRDDRKGAKPYKSYPKTSAWGHTKDERGIKRPYRRDDLESKNKPYRQDDREIQYGGKNKAPAKPAYNKFGASPKAGSKREGAPVRKPGGPFKKFFKMGHPPKSQAQF